jgi:hypothetical protein
MSINKRLAIGRNFEVVYFDDGHREFFLENKSYIPVYENSLVDLLIKKIDEIENRQEAKK